MPYIAGFHGAMPMEIIRQYKKQYPNTDRKIVEVMKVDDARYADGIIYTFRYLRYEAKKEEYETAFAIENSHGQPHIHRENKREDVDFDWKKAMSEFERMVKGYRKMKYGKD
ncbi:hypothetical protein AUJ17_02530 [Candidatus Micrarchaeota archaeon CG1_02_47_40]|nr:MAG: hypothetical protein AUJ17_02530 [Candidatus Micrarchaeota archaeon CG1_02_47_40]